MKKEKNKSEVIKTSIKGITLIALVVTIIVLLILAGVAISLTIGQNGIFKRAQDAVELYENASNNELIALNEFSNFIDSSINNNEEEKEEYNTATTVEDAKTQNLPFENDTTIKDDLENEIRIPGGFKVAEDSATKVEDGVVIEDKSGNQFVWIPAKSGSGATIHTTLGDKTIVYKRTSFVQSGEYSDYSEEMPSDEEQSVNAWGGYYIGRYESGDEVATEAKTMRTSPTSNRRITIKKDQVPYNYIMQVIAKTIAENMCIEQDYGESKTRLISSYAWDTAISFIQIKNSNYGKSSPGGNYLNTTFEYIDINGVKQTKELDTRVLVPTGQTTAVSNIYDMGGNLYEYTSETYENSRNSYNVVRGGDTYGGYSNNGAGERALIGGGAAVFYGFRVTLYCSVQN